MRLGGNVCVCGVCGGVCVQNVPRYIFAMPRLASAKEGGGGGLVQYARIQPFAVTFCTDKYAGRHVFRFANMYSMYTISGRVEKGRSVGNMYGSLEVVRNQF